MRFLINRQNYTRLFAIVLCLALVSCSQVKLAYGFLDNWIRWQAQAYISVTPEQKMLLKNLSKSFHQWHRENELEDYAAFLAALEQRFAQQQLIEQDFYDTFEQVETLWTRSEQQLKRSAEQFLVTLTPEQHQEIIDQLIEEQTDFQQTYLLRSTEEATESKSKGVTKVLKRFIGRLTKEQEQIVYHWAEKQQDTAVFMLHQQLLWRSQFIHSLNQTAPQQSTATLLLKRAEPVGQKHADQEAHNRALTRQMIMQLHQSLTEKQQERLNKTLRSYQKDLLALSGNSERGQKQ